ncbi:MAG: DUF1800 family protein [Hyphomicrobiaceae bacterium]
MGSRATLTDAMIALNRFGLGAHPDEPLPSDAKTWLLGQLDAFAGKSAIFQAARASEDIAAEFAAGQQRVRNADEAGKMAIRQDLRKQGQALYRAEVEMRARAALDATAPFIERLVHFWSNHFAVSANKPQVTVLAGAFEREAIRPYVLGRFEDMLLAVERHPAMHHFLDQVRSIGPNSPAAQRVAARKANRKLGINENLAREIMELHTLGARSGYSQKDVTEFALALTGWSAGMMGSRNQTPGTFTFLPARHEPGARTIMGKTYGQRGQGQARAVLADLAATPATADHIAAKLARHFIADVPPQSIVERLSAAFRVSGGDLPTVYRALIDAPEAWMPQPVKFKTPWDWTISALRAIGRRDVDGMNLTPLLNQLGQPVWRPGSPAGYDDMNASWAAPDALVRRVEVAQRFAARAASGHDARTLARKLYADSLSEPTKQQIDRAESPQTALALLLVSPEFQRR